MYRKCSALPISNRLISLPKNLTFSLFSYGIKKLQITCVIEDDKVMMDDLEDQVVGFEDYVQSMDIVAFNKI